MCIIHVSITHVLYLYYQPQAIHLYYQPQAIHLYYQPLAIHLYCMCETCVFQIFYTKE